MKKSVKTEEHGNSGQDLMHREKSPGYVEYLTFLYFLSSVFFLGTVIPFRRAAWAQILCGALPALFVLLGFQWILRRRSVGVFRSLIAALSAACLCALSLYCLAQFLFFCVLQELPVWLFPAAFLLCAGYGAMRDVRLLERFCKLCGPAVALLLFLTLLSGIAKIRFSLQYGQFFWRDYLPADSDSFWSGTLFFGGLFFLEGIVLLTLFHIESAETDAAPQPRGLDSAFSRGFLPAAFAVAAVYLITVLSLGPEVFERLTYPVYYPPGLSGSAEYLERTEIILLTVLILSEFVKTTACLLMIKKSLLRLFRPRQAHICSVQERPV